MPSTQPIQLPDLADALVRLADALDRPPDGDGDGDGQPAQEEVSSAVE